VSTRDMSANTFHAKLALLLLLSVCLLEPAKQWAQERGQDGSSLKPFAGTWKGTCADGKEFVVLTLNWDGTGLGGTIRLANMHGDGGQCATVVDPPSPEHAMKISDVQLRGKALGFRGSANAEFEMTLAGADRARLKFMGTPVEDNPWELKKAQ